MTESNWGEVRQALVNDIASFTKEFLTAASIDIRDRLLKQGVPSEKISISSDRKRISMETNIQSEYENGKVYFEKVYNEISDASWLETLK